jgi:hypothetical protein
MPPTSVTPPTKPTPPAGPHRTLTQQQPPLSPEAKSREKDRISLLLLINGELLQEVIRLRSEGKSGVPQPSPQNDGKAPQTSEETAAESSKKTPAHPDYIEYADCIPLPALTLADAFPTISGLACEQR